MEWEDQRLHIFAVQGLSPFSTCEDESEMAYYFAYGSNLNLHDWRDYYKEHGHRPYGGSSKKQMSFLLIQYR